MYVCMYVRMCEQMYPCAGLISGSAQRQRTTRSAQQSPFPMASARNSLTFILGILEPHVRGGPGNVLVHMQGYLSPASY